MTGSEPTDERPSTLKANLKERIAASPDRLLSVADYYAACTAHYYGRGDALGRDGDFITTPEISQIFGELIGLWCAVVWQGMGAPAHWHLVELGPGRGTMMRDCLRAMRLVPACRDGLHVHLVEPSHALRQLQSRTLSDWSGPLGWLDDTARLPPGPAIVLGNEYVDALAIDQFEWQVGTWHRRGISLGHDDRLSIGRGPGIAPSEATADLAALMQQLASTASAGDVLEYRPLGVELATLADRSKQGLALLLIDYGHAQSALGDTLQAVRDHRYENPLLSPGAADITSQVDFALLSQQLADRGLYVSPTSAQAEFLSNLGIAERASRLMSANPAEANAIEMAVSRLMSPSGMGARFKVLGAHSPHLPPLPGLPVRGTVHVPMGDR